ncbi:hypothetical protein BH11MYX1_BH11MYX1_22760 [soil metagenome]
MGKLLLSLFVLGACGADPVLESPDAGGGGSNTPGYQTLVSTGWSLAPSSEKYECYRVTLTEDIWVKSIKPISPQGTHHSVLMLATTPSAPDGLTECSSLLSEPAIYASGVGTTELVFPDGIGLHLLAGQQLFLNVHLFNSGDATLDGTSGIEYQSGDSTSIVHEAGSVLIGAANGPTVPVGQNVALSFQCKTPAASVMFAVAPHMHLNGTHLTASYTPPNGVATTLLDTAYSFDDQKFHLFAPVTSVTGGKYKVTCTYDNESGSPIPFGESTTQEMCYAMTYVYPPPTAPTCGTQI